MSAATSSWWAIGGGQKSPNVDVFAPTKPTKFNTLASTLGLRPKNRNQPPPLTIVRGETLSPPIPPATSRRPYTAPSSPRIAGGRPPSNSVSSSRSRVDSLEPTTPRTPEDVIVRRGSLLTLSDADPFAARVVSVHSPSDPNRLSAFSNSSREQKSPPADGFNRVSYASSSSQSFRMGGELSPLSPISDAGSSPIVMPADKKSTSSLRRKESGADNRYSTPDPPPKPRPAMRARGMTDGGLDRVPFLRTDSFNRATAPKSPVTSPTSRKLSQRTAPPTADLPSPPPPQSPESGPLSASSTSSTSLSEWRPLKPRNSRRTKASSHEPEPRAPEDADPQPRVHRTLKKSMSQQSLNKHRAQAASPSASISTLPDSAASSSAGPRKQRSFHRLPVHAVPLQLPLSEQRAEPSQRKRLFSTSSSRRPSQSTLALTDETRSISESDRATLSGAGASSSCWIDLDQGPRTPTSVAQEYTPQQIMSPAEMLEVEARVDAEYHSRPRGASIMSTSTTAMSELDHELSPSLSFGGGRKRSNSEHPSLSSYSTSPRDMYWSSLAPEPPSPPMLMSLPPPPRRTKSRTSSVSSSTQPDVRTSTLSSRSQPNMPLSRAPPNPLPSLSPPPRKVTRTRTAQDKRQSLMRKPSFLEFEDDLEKEPLPPLPPPVLIHHDSFLDLTRESFDSSRSDDSF